MSPSLCKNLVEIGPVVSEIFDQMCSAVAVGVGLVQITANSMELFFSEVPTSFSALHGSSLGSRFRFFEETFKETTPRCIVVTRNLKDALVSYYHFYRSVQPLGNFSGSFSEFLELYKADRLVHGDWFDFNLGWWEHREHPNFLFLTYEDMKMDP